jgi:hypothetical protein
VTMDGWSKESIDLVEPAYIEFGDGKRGSLHFICIYADIDYQINQDNKITFSFQGDDEGQTISGRGWAKIKNGGLQGRLFIHNGDESYFTAQRVESRL